MSLQELVGRYEHLKGTEQQKNVLIEELLHKLGQLEMDFEQVKMDHSRESQFNRETQKRERNLLDELRKYKTLSERDPFVLVLIDADGMIFNDGLIQMGDEGGRQAANLLWNALQEHMEKELDLTPNVKIVVRAYANLKGLGDACYKAGILARPSLMDDFARGFTGAKQLFDFVDVGAGKDRADDKLSEIFKLHLHSFHCRHIYFGCSHDNGYARTLEDISEPAVQKSITLLEGVPFERELAFLKSKYRTSRLESIFRNNKISVSTQQLSSTSSFSNGAGSGFSGPTPAQVTASKSPSVNGGVPLATRSSGLNATAPTWANTAMNAAPPSSSPPLQVYSSNSTPQIPRNKYGERVDLPLDVDRYEFERVKRLKLCNVHHLRGDCFRDDCSHNHEYKPTKGEMQCLRQLSRMFPCKLGPICDEYNCIFGHRCPSDEEGKDTCSWGKNCRFPPEMHGMDRKVVRTTKVTGK